MSLDVINTAISITSLVVALCTAFAAHHYFLRSQHQRDEELIQNVLKTFSTFKIDVSVTLREREKTGKPLHDDERDLFTNCQFISVLVAELEEVLHAILKDRKKLTPEIRSAMQSVLALVDGMSRQLQMLSARFHNFNNNRVAQLHELCEKIPELQAILQRAMANR